MEKEKFDDSLNQDLFKKYNDHKDLSVRQDIVILNQPLVAYIIKKYYSKSVETAPEAREDMYQEGVMGLMYAIDKFDINLGFKFSTYATWWIKQRINNYLGANSTIQVPNHIKSDQNKLFRQLREESKLISDLDDEDYQKYNLTAKKFERIKNAISSRKLVSINAPISKTENAATYEEIIVDEKAVSESFFDKKLIMKAVKDALRTMPEKRKLILLLRYGIITEADILNKDKDDD